MIAASQHSAVIPNARATRRHDTSKRYSLGGKLESGANHEQQHNAYVRERFSYSEPTDFDTPPVRVQNDDVHRFDNVGAYNNLGVDYRAGDALTLGLQARAQDDHHLEERNVVGKFGGFALLDLSAKYRINPRMSVDVQVRNLTGRDYVYAWYDSFFQDTAQPMFSPGLGRTAFVSFNLRM